ncbi:Elicitor-like transglutaminase [Phytophthora palmivora]|uniref:Sugar transporter SWEET1 n=1 Tax=Phytophthora palmivora TaxID=4796 RepID=A0A2P4WXM1_9STRA|nr:Elicitor-like transglutaminase [Phytophthora palmivora]
MVTISRSIALTTTAIIATTTVIEASPLQYDPYTPVNISTPLTSSHPAFGGETKECIEPIVPEDPNQSKAESMTLLASFYRKLHTMEDSTSSDIQDLEMFFGSKMEVNFQTLKEEFAPSEKYAKAYGLNVADFQNKISTRSGVDSRKTSTACTVNSDCKGREDGSICAKREGFTTGYCIPGWFGICHAWAPAAILEPEPQCDVTKNGVTFHVMDIKGLITSMYDGASIKTVFTGARFYGPDSPTNKDQYDRFTDAARRDLGAGYFHIAITNIMAKQNRSFVVDVTAGAEVWNQPVRSFKVKSMDLVNIRTASMMYFGVPAYPFNDKTVHLAYVKTSFSWVFESYNDGPLVSSGQIDSYTQSKDYEYLLELDGDYNIIGGEWVGQSKEDHPDFLWFPIAKPASNAIAPTDIRVVHQQKSTASMPSALPVLSMVGNCVAWGLYGLLIGDYFPLVATNIVGLTLSLFYLIVYYYHEANKCSLRLEILATTLVLVGLVLYPFVASSEGVEEESIQNIVGFVTVGISAVMFGSPLVLVKRVIQERNTELLPLTMIVTGAVNCILWLAYGLLLNDAFVIVPNAANLLLGVVQLGLFCVYPRGGTYDTVESSSKRKNEAENEIEKSATTIDTEDEPSNVDEEQESTKQSDKLETTIKVH